jgi:subtilase family serine protease
VDTEHQGVVGKSVAFAVLAGPISLLLLSSLLRPVLARPHVAEVTITPTAFVYMPYTARYEVPEVDLIVWDILIDPEEPSVYEPFEIIVKVRNQGSDSTTESTSVELSAGGFEEDFPIPPLAAYATVSVGWGLSLSTAYTYTAEAEVDPGDFILETNEGNNSLSQEFYVVE